MRARGLWAAARAAGLASLLVMVVSGPQTACSGAGASARPDTAEGQDLTGLVGLWSDHRTWFALRSDGTFRWEEPTLCGLPPCPLDVLEGRAVREADGALVLEPTGDKPVRLTVALRSAPRKLVLTRADRGGQRWTLEPREPQALP